MNIRIHSIIPAVPSSIVVRTAHEVDTVHVYVERVVLRAYSEVR
jgi:hypothetical protein